MDKETVFTAYIGETDVFEWTQGIGKHILMPILLKVCEQVIYNDLEEKTAARIEFLLRGKPKSYDFLVKFDGIEDTLEKIMSWALEEEEYEMCRDIKHLQEYVYEFKIRLQNDKFK